MVFQSVPQVLKTDASEASGEKQTPVSLWVRHSDLYFFDGTIVLLAGDTLFRVYLGLLSKYSKVFRDMASLHAHQPVDMESYEGCPLVRLSDSPDDLTHFLKALIDINAFPGSNRPTPYSILAGILRLSTKYAVLVLRTRVIAHFGMFYPSNFNEAEIDQSEFVKRRGIACFGEDPSCWPSYSASVALFRECKVNRFLPWAFYRLCERGFEALLNIVHDGGLSPEDTRIVLHGWHELVRTETQTNLGIFSAHVPHYGVCNAPEDQLLRKRLGDRWDAIPFSGPNRNLSTLMCCRCADHLREAYTTALKSLWERLPAIFDLPPWEELL